MRHETFKSWARPLVLGLLVVHGWTASAGAQPLPLDEVPVPLRPWVDWVLDAHPEHACPGAPDAPVCAWPGALRLEVEAAGARFEQRVHADAEATVFLPGNHLNFPLDVSVDGRPATVLDQGGSPHVRVQPGDHTVIGRIAWDAIPEVMRIPPSTGIVELRIGGVVVAQPHRELDGTLWIQRREEEAREEERLSVEVYRQVRDGVPMVVETHIVLRAGGRSREVPLGQVLLPSSVPVSIGAEIPARLDAEGNLTVQVRAGTYSVDVVARVSPSVAELRMPTLPAPWPTEEVWVFAPDETLRQVELSGAPAVDPARTSMPDHWRGFAAYALDPSRTLALATTRRGEADPAPNALTLARELWLDLDGEGYTVRDTFSGSMRRGFRLDLLEGELGHVVVDGRDELITEGPEGAGVELRLEGVNVQGEWRAPEALRELPAVGWSEDVQSASATLRLPPGWLLFATSGVDDVDGTWMDRWDVYAFFFVLIVALAATKLSGPALGALALGTLVVCYGEADAPKVVWLVLIALVALLRVLPPGWVHKSVRVLFALAALGLVLIVVPFAAEQLRKARFPQLDPEGLYGNYGEPMGGAGFGLGMVGGAAAPMMQEMPAEAPAPEDATTEGGGGMRAMEEESMARRSSGYAPGVLGAISGADQERAYRAEADTAAATAALQRQDPNAQIQTGPGVPDWSFRTWELRWSGSVAEDHRMTLWLLSPAMQRFLALLRVAFLFALGIALVRLGLRSGPRVRPAAPPSSTAGTAAAAAALLGLLLAPARGAAQDGFPSDELLGDLGERLTRAPECAPACVSLSTMHLTVGADTLEAELEAHAGANVGLRLPGPVSSWAPTEVQIDGRATQALRVDENGFLVLRLPEGRHRVLLRGRIVGDLVGLGLPELPHRVTMEAPGWDVEGVRPDGRVEPTIQLRRLVESAGEAGFDAQNLAPWLLVTRRLEIGVQWSVTTTVQRLSATGSPLVVRVPLLAGQSVTDETVLVEDGHAVVSFGRDVSEIRFASTLPVTPELELTAAEGKPWSEQWAVACGPIYRCSHEGVTPTRHLSGGAFEPFFHPWPGESLKVRFERPAAVPGQTVTVDRADLSLVPGIRRLSATLGLQVRATQGGPYTITLPEGAHVESLTVEGTPQPAQLDGRTLRVTLHPGSQSVQVVWQQHEGLAARFVAPEVKLGSALVNAHVQIQLPEDRWLVWVTGPSWGPAILFWPFLFLVLIVAVGLSRVPLSPLGARDWALLGLGLAQIPVPAALVVVGWFFALAHREKHPEYSPSWFDVRQLALLVLTLAALGCLYAAVHTGLLLRPDMQVAGAGSYETQLAWYLDRTDGTVPRPGVVSFPLWAYRVLMLAWALWLAFRLIGWLRDGWTAFSTGGLWKKSPPKPRPPAPMAGAGGFGAPKPAPVAAPAPKPPEPEPKAEPEPEPEPEP